MICDYSLSLGRIFARRDGGAAGAPVTAYDGNEAFRLEAVEAAFYEVVAADPDELLGLNRPIIDCFVC